MAVVCEGRPCHTYQRGTNIRGHEARIFSPQNCDLPSACAIVRYRGKPLELPLAKELHRHRHVLPDVELQAGLFCLCLMRVDRDDL